MKHVWKPETLPVQLPETRRCIHCGQRAARVIYRTRYGRYAGRDILGWRPVIAGEIHTDCVVGPCLAGTRDGEEAQA